MTQSIYEALLNSNAVAEFDVQGHILWANQNFLNTFKYTLEEIVGQHHSVLLPDFHQNERVYLEMWEQLRQGLSQAGEFKRLSRESKILWIQGSYTPVKDEHGQVVKIVKMAIDITEKKNLAEHLEKKNNELVSVAAKAKAATHAKSIFLANMSHEIRTPLNSIIGITDTLAETSLDQQQSSFVEVLQKANQQLMTIINDILDLAKVEEGEVELRQLPFELKKVMDDLAAILGFRAKEKGLELSIHVDPTLDSYYVGDADRLRQILMNLLNNAIKFTQKGSICLRVSRNSSSLPGSLLFSVQDTGIGIPKAKHKDIFQPFTQADSTTTKRYGGSGLGLSITKNLVELMQGQIWLESEVNVGTTFYFTANLTVVKSTMPENLRKGKTASLHKSPYLYAPRRLKILVVDDVEDNRNLIGIYLQNTTHQISYAESGSDALQLISKENFDIIFMDVQMPEMDGYEATRSIRNLEKKQGRASSRIIACTANAFSEDVERSLSAGCDVHLSKPIRKDTLIEAINSYFNPVDNTY